ncbi:MAG: universal stress protein [Vicinamibacterales bacterium]
MNERFVVLLTTAPTLHESARELASRLAARANATLLFLHVVPGASHGESMLHAAVELASGAPEAWLRTLRPSHAGVPFRHRLELGDPADIAAGFVREHSVELMVVEEPPRSRIAEALWRGLAETLIRRVDCPVVIGGPGFLRSAPPATPPIRPMLEAGTVAELLNAMVEARVDALRSWMARTAESVGRIAAADTVTTAVTLARDDEPIDASLERRLIVELDEHQRALRAIAWRLMTPHQSWGSEALTPVQGPAFAEFVRRVDAGGQSTSLPLALDDGLERLVILAGARVSGGAGGMLLFGFDAEDDFLRILAQPGPLPTFETYAFDSAGLMLSNSRFPEHLLASGLLAIEGQQTPLRLRVAEPSDGPVEGWPLTRMAQDATRHHDGFDTRGYLDYRGTRVVGAWRWVPEYGFGVTAEIDHAAAYPAEPIEQS